MEKLTFPRNLWGSKRPKKGAFFKVKMTKIGILNTKLIVLNNYQEFWVHFEWFLSLFQIPEVK